MGATDKKEIVNPYGKLFEGEGLTVEMATMLESNADGLQDVLLKFSGAAAYEEGIDGKVMHYRAVPAGTGVDFKYVQGGSERTRMLSRASWGTWKFFEVFFGNKTIKVYHDNEKSKQVRPLHLLSASIESAKAAS